MALSKPLEDFDKLLECPICLERLQAPQILPCLHSFCKHCIQSHIAKSVGKTSFKCPVCRVEFPTPEEGSSVFKSNAFLSEVRDHYPLKADGVRCELCGLNGNDEAAVSLCIQCSCKVCEQCAQLHTRYTINHQVVSLSEVKAGRHFEDMRRDEKVYCPEHEDELLKMYCLSCEEPLCLLCSLYEHAQHKLEKVEDSVKSANVDISSLLEPWQATTNHYEQLLKEQEDNLVMVDEREEQGLNAIKQAYENFEASVEASRTSAIKEFKGSAEIARREINTYCNEIKQQKNSIAITMNYATGILRSAGDIEKMRQLRSIKTRLAGLSIPNTETHFKTPVLDLDTSNLSVPDLEVHAAVKLEDQQMSSKLSENSFEYTQVLQSLAPSSIEVSPSPVVQDQAVLIKTLVGSQGSCECYGMALCDNRVITADVKNKSVKVFDRRSGALLFEVKQDKHVLQEPRDVTCDQRTGHIFVCDDGIKGVVHYNSQGHVMKVTPNLYPDSCGHIALFRSRLYIADEDGQRILVTDMDCNIKQVIGKLSLGFKDGDSFSPRCLFVGELGKLVVSDYSYDRVYLLDCNVSAVVYTKHVSAGHLHGVCSDQRWNVLVADTSRDQVLLLSGAEGDARVIVPSDVLTNPTAVALAAPGEVAVLEKDTGAVKLFRYLVG